MAGDGLHDEAYAALAEAEGERVLSEALERFDILDARRVHRTGDLVIGDIAVWVGVTAAHRDAAVAACRQIIDEVKARAPLWMQIGRESGTEEVCPNVLKPVEAVSSEKKKIPKIN